MEESKRFKNHKEDEETFKKISNGKFGQHLSVDRKIWCISAVKFMRIDELQRMNDMVLCSRYVSKILEEGRKALESMLCTAKYVSMKNVQIRKLGYQRQIKVCLDPSWLGFFSNTICSNLVELNEYLNNYLVYLQYSNLVVGRRNLRQFPIRIFVKSEYPKFPLDSGLESSESEETDVYCKWALNELIVIKTSFTRVVKNLDILMNRISEVCEEISETHESMEKLQSKPEDSDKFNKTLKTLRTNFFYSLLEGEEDEKTMEDGGELGSKKPRIYYDFI